VAAGLDWNVLSPEKIRALPTAVNGVLVRARRRLVLINDRQPRRVRDQRDKKFLVGLRVLIHFHSRTAIF
jgi:hypothetical protein